MKKFPPGISATNMTFSAGFVLLYVNEPPSCVTETAAALQVVVRLSR